MTNAEGVPEQRKELRQPVRAAAIIEQRTGRRISGSTVDLSGSGVLLDLAQPADLAVGEEVGCSVQLYPGKAPQAWGVGKVVRVDRLRVAIQFTGIDWDPS
jgi:hypothetical protein